MNCASEMKPGQNNSKSRFTYSASGPKAKVIAYNRGINPCTLEVYQASAMTAMLAVCPNSSAWCYWLALIQAIRHRRLKDNS